MKHNTNIISFTFSILLLVGCKDRVISDNHNILINRNYNSENNKYENNTFSIDRHVLNKKAKELVENFNVLHILLNKSHNLEENIFPILLSNSNENTKIYFINSKIIEIKEFESKHNLKSLNNFFDAITNSISNLKKYYSSHSNEKFTQEIKDIDFNSAYFLSRIIKEVRELKNTELERYIFAYFNTGFNINNINKIDLRNMIIQLSKHLLFNTDESINFNKNLETFLSNIINKKTTFNFNFYEFYTNHINIEKHNYFLQFNYEINNKSLGIKNKILLDGEFSPEISFNDKLYLLKSDVKNIRIDYDIEFENSMSFNSEILNYELINHFLLSYQQFGKSNLFHNFNHYEDISALLYNNLAHTKLYYLNKTKRIPAQIIPVKKIDFTEKKKVKISFGDYFVYETKNWEKYGGIFYATPRMSDEPYHSGNKNETFSLLSALNLKSEISFKSFEDIPTILPTMPEGYLSYNYKAIPSIFEFNDKYLDLIKSIQRNNKNKFVYEYYDWKFHQHAVNKLSIEYIPTETEIILSPNKNILVVPNIPLELANKINYKLKGNGGDYYFNISPYAEYQIDANENDNWIIDASEINGEAYVYANIVLIGSKIIHFTSKKKPNELIIIQKNGAIRKIDFSSGKSLIIAIDAKNLTDADIQTYLQEATSYSNQYNGYIEILGYGGTALSLNAWYDISEKRIISEKQRRNYFINSQVIIGKNSHGYFIYDINDKSIYFYCKIKNTFQLIEREVINYFYSENTLYIKNSQKVILALENLSNIKIISYNEFEVKFPQLLEYARKNNYIMVDSILRFNAENKFLGWDISQTQEFIAAR